MLHLRYPAPMGMMRERRDGRQLRPRIVSRAGASLGAGATLLAVYGVLRRERHARCVADCYHGRVPRKRSAMGAIRTEDEKSPAAGGFYRLPRQGVPGA